MGDLKGWMPIYWGDYLRDTAHLSAAEHGAYLLLIGHYWTTGKPLPDDDEQLRRIARMERREWKRARPVIAAFFHMESGHWTHRRIDGELAAWSEKKARNTQRASIAARGRWAPKGDATSMLQACDKHAASNAYAMLEQCPSPTPLEREDDVPSGTLSAGADFASPGDAIRDMVAAYNAVAAKCGLPAVRKLDDRRRRQAGVRLREHGMEGWRTALVRLAENPWMHGQNDRGWRADFDFLLQPKSLTRLLEGGYDRKPIARVADAPEPGEAQAKARREWYERTGEWDSAWGAKPERAEGAAA